jgi:hypothetical protein
VDQLGMRDQQFHPLDPRFVQRGAVHADLLDLPADVLVVVRGRPGLDHPRDVVVVVFQGGGELAGDGRKGGEVRRGHGERSDG